MHVAITGASSGIGEALAREYARAGAKLTLVARRRELLERLDEACGGGSFVVPHDLSDPARATEWLARAEAAHGPIDVLVNNAGMENSGATARSDPAEGLKLLALNLLSPLAITRAALPAMLERKAGALVQVASIAALSALPGQAWYAASKAGLAQFGETLRFELAGTGVHSLVVYPGPVKTAMGDAAYEKYGGRKGIARLLPEGTPDELARLVCTAVARRRKRVIYPRLYASSYLVPWLARAFTGTFSPRPA